MRNATTTTGVFTEYAYTEPTTLEVTRLDYAREGHELVVTATMTSPVPADQLAVVRDSESFLVVSATDGALLTTIAVDRPVHWDNPRLEPAPQGLRLRLPLRGPQPLRVTPHIRPRSWGHRLRAWLRWVGAAVSRLPFRSRS